MKHEIIYTQDFALIVSDEEITKGDFCYDLDASPGYKNHKSIVRCLRTAKDSYWNKNCKKIIAHRPFTDAPVLEGVPILPEFSEEDDIKLIAKQEAEKLHDKSRHEDWDIYEELVSEDAWLIEKGYNKAKETYKYTEEDLISFHKWAFQKVRIEESDKNTKELLDEWQSLQQPKRPKYFECEYKPITPHKYTVDDHLEVELKTTTNSQGQTELVGEYIYE
jgi:hypothetical protein